MDKVANKASAKLIKPSLSNSNLGFCARAIFYLVLGILFFPPEELSAQTQIPEDRVEKIIYVNIQHPQASDENPGTALLPLKSIGRAVEAAVENNKKNVGAKILIYPGTYREKTSLLFNGEETDAPIVFEAKEKGKVIVSGSNIWTAWKKYGNTSTYTHYWPYKWGLTPIPPEWEGEVEVKPIVRRREMIFINGKLLEQVLSFSRLKEGSFYVSEEEKTVYIRLREGIDVENSTIEVAVRSKFFRVKGKTNIVLRGLTFIHDNTPIDSGAVKFSDSSNILVEDCRFLWNNWGGLGFNSSQNVTVRRNAANNNGGRGMSAAGIINLLFEDNKTSFNNWRGARGGYYGWSAAGIKSLLIHNGTYRRHKSVGNQASGFWLDTDCANILIEEAFWCNNLTNGVFIEASQGPTTIRGSTICHNRGKSGVLLSNSSNVTLENNIIYGNGGSQIKVRGSFEREITDFETWEEMTLKDERLTLKDNVIVGKDSNQLLMDIIYWIDLENFLSTLTSGRNLWYVPNREYPFRVGTTDLDFSGWQSATDQDTDSTFADPKL